MTIRSFARSAVILAVTVVPLSAGQTPVAKTGETKSGETKSGETKSAAAARPAGKWAVPRTPWGDPDLQGLWPSIDMQGTPYERPPELAGKAVLSDEEFKAREAAQNARRRGWGETGVAQRQASLIVEPADGRLPPLTAEGQRRFATARSTYYLDFPDAVCTTTSTTSRISAPTTAASRAACWRR